jgi:N-glycosylase/DNA lyase
MKINITRQDREGLSKVFENFGRKKTDEEIFYDLCFTILAPQTKFQNNIKVIKDLQDRQFYLYKLTKPENLGYWEHTLPEILKPVRFYKNKTKYILEAKKKFPEILRAISSLDTWDNKESIHIVDIYKIREWLIDNVKGMGYKTASHFLRNMGNTEVAIIDTHIIKFLAEELCVTFGLTYEEAVKEFRKQAGKKEGYLALEKLFQNIAKQNGLSCAELDSFLWKYYSGTSWEDFKY